MSSRTTYLSRLIGLYCVLISLSMAAHKEATVTAVNAYMHDAPALLLAGVIALVAGLAIVLGHNVWSGGALPVLVTLTGWIALSKGLMLLLLSPTAGFLEAIRYEQFFYLYIAITLALGAYLTYGGFRSASR